MLKKSLFVAICTAAGLCATSPASAGYVQTATNFDANYAFSNFQNNDGAFNLAFSNISGKLEFNLPGATPGAPDRHIVLDWGNGTGTPVFTKNGVPYTGSSVGVTGAGISEVLSLFLPSLAAQLTPVINASDVFVLNFDLASGLNFGITDTRTTVSGAPVSGPTVENALLQVSVTQPSVIQNTVVANGSVSDATNSIITNNVPEPESFALMGVGMAGLFAALRRKMR